MSLGEALALILLFFFEGVSLAHEFATTVVWCNWLRSRRREAEADRRELRRREWRIKKCWKARNKAEQRKKRVKQQGHSEREETDKSGAGRNSPGCCTMAGIMTCEKAAERK